MVRLNTSMWLKMGIVVVLCWWAIRVYVIFLTYTKVYVWCARRYPQSVAIKM